MEYLLQAVPTDEPIEVTAVQLSINFGSIHTSYVLISCNIQFYLYYPPTLRDSASLSGRRRKHPDGGGERALESEGGWTK